MFVLSNTLMGGSSRLISVAGFFVPVYIAQRYSTPVRSINVPAAHEVLDNGIGCTVFNYSSHTNIMDMSNVQLQPTAAQIISEITSFDSPSNIRENLHELIILFSTHCTDVEPELKQRIYLTYQALSDALKKMQPVQLRPNYFRRKSVTVTEFVNTLNRHNINMTEESLLAWLRNNGYLINRTGINFNTPTKQAVKDGLLELKKVIVNHREGSTSLFKITKIKDRGQALFFDKLKG